MIIATYGSLRKGMKNHEIMKKYGRYLGTYSVEYYVMVKCGGQDYPRVVENVIRINGKRVKPTPIVVEVYEIPDDVFYELAELERRAGYYMQLIDIPYSSYQAIMWFSYHNFLYDVDVIESGDWVKFVREHY